MHGERGCVRAAVDMPVHGAGPRQRSRAIPAPSRTCRDAEPDRLCAAGMGWAAPPDAAGRAAIARIAGARSKGG